MRPHTPVTVASALQPQLLLNLSTTTGKKREPGHTRKGHGSQELPHKDPSQSTRPTNATATVDASLPQTTPNGCVSHAARFLLHDVRRVPACVKCVYAASGAYTRIGAFTHPTPRLRICACTRWCWTAGGCV